MGQFTFIINDKKDIEFRQAVSNKKGYRKGNLQEAFVEALDLWIEKNND